MASITRENFNELKISFNLNFSKMENLFQEPNNIFFWKDVKTYLIRNQYNELLNFVVDEYYKNQYKDLGKYTPPFLNFNNCLTIRNFDGKCARVCSVLDGGHSDLRLVSSNGSTSSASKNKFDNAKKEHAIALAELGKAQINLDYGIKNFKMENAANPN